MRLITLALCVLLTACNQSTTLTPAAGVIANAANNTAKATLGDANLQASTIAIANLNTEVAARYGLDRKQDGVLLLVTLRDADGNALAPGDLQVTATASILPAAPKPVQMQAMLVEDMTDYVGVIPATPPANVQFQIVAVRNGARVDMTTMTDLQPR